MSFAVVFPGQGSQHPGMGKFLYSEFKSVQRLFEEASDAVNVNFKKLMFDGADSDLALTENTQPCLLIVSVAGFRTLQDEFGFQPKATAGHSVGEYAAAVSSGVLGFTDGVKAVRIRGQAMQSAVPLGEGGMSAIMGMDADQVRKTCEWAMEETGIGPIEPANFNAPGQIVISGKLKLLQWLSENFKPEVLGQEKMRVKFIPLKVSAPFHCSMMKPAQEKMREVLNAMEFNTPQFPIVQNVTAQSTNDASIIRTNLIEQVSKPVRWIECIETLKKLDAAKMVECGSGKVLSGLSKKIDSEGIQTFNMTSMDEFKELGKMLS